MPDLYTAHMSNSAIVGFGGFGLTTIIQQLHELSLCGAGPGIACGLIFGGIVQFIVGLQELRCGNNFGYAFFTSFGIFWLVYSFAQLFERLEVYQSGTVELWYFLIIWNVYVMIFWVISFFIHIAMVSMFTWLLLGFVLLNLGNFGFPAMNKVAAFAFIFSGLNGWYISAHLILKDIIGRDVLTVGEPWLKLRQ